MNQADVAEVRKTTCGFIVAGDLNGKAIARDMPLTKTRGRYILEKRARTDLHILNRGNVSTIPRHGYGEMIPVVSLTSEDIVICITDGALPRTILPPTTRPSFYGSTQLQGT